MTTAREVRLWSTLGLAAAMVTVSGPAAAEDLLWKAPAAWAGALGRMDAALSRGDRSAASQAWQEAHLTALAIRGWEGVVAVGAAALRLNAAAEVRHVGRATARHAYTVALYRARALDSLEGVLRATEAMAALGEADAAQWGLRLAEELAGRTDDPRDRARVREVAARLGGDRHQTTGSGAPRF